MHWGFQLLLNKHFGNLEILLSLFTLRCLEHGDFSDISAQMFIENLISSTEVIYVGFNL